MALIKCSECGAEISDKAKKCPSCGYTKEVKYCPECGKELSTSARMCPECGYSFENNTTSSNSSDSTNNGENYGLAIAGFICSFLVPILGLIFGIIALSSNKGKENTAKSFGLAATIISSISLAIGLILLLSWISLAGLYFYY